MAVKVKKTKSKIVVNNLSTEASVSVETSDIPCQSFFVGSEAENGKASLYLKDDDGQIVRLSDQNVVSDSDVCEFYNYRVVDVKISVL